MFFKCFLCFVLGKSKCAGTTSVWNGLCSFFVCLQYNANGPNLKKSLEPYLTQILCRILCQAECCGKGCLSLGSLSVVVPSPLPWAADHVVTSRISLLTLKSSSMGIPLVGWVDLKGAAFHHVPLVTAEWILQGYFLLSPLAVSAVSVTLH